MVNIVHILEMCTTFANFSMSIIYIYIYIYHILYIIAEAERKWMPTFKEELTNRKKDPLKY